MHYHNASLDTPRGAQRDVERRALARPLELKLGIAGEKQRVIVRLCEDQRPATNNLYKDPRAHISPVVNAIAGGGPFSITADHDQHAALNLAAMIEIDQVSDDRQFTC